MFLSIDEFKSIRPFQWRIQNYGKKNYNTLTNEVDLQLWWIDFIRLIFVPNFKKQNAITSIPKFDLKQPVLLTDDLELILPNNIETIMYYAKNKTLPIKFSLNITQDVIVFIGVGLLIFIIIIELFLSKFIKFNCLI